MAQTTQTQQRTTDAEVGVPEAVLAYARGQRNGEVVVEAWQLHALGGLNAPTIAKRLGPHPDTVRRWFREIRAALGVGKDGAEAGPSVPPRVTTPVHNAILKANDVAQKRADLLRRAEQEDKLDLQARLLDSESRRLGMDVQRVEQTSLTMQLQLMPPEQRRAELLQRLQRMALRGTLRPSDLIGANADHVRDEAPGGTPPPGAPSRVLEPAYNHTPKNPECVSSKEEGDGDGQGELGEWPEERGGGTGDEGADVAGDALDPVEARG